MACAPFSCLGVAANSKKLLFDPAKPALSAMLEDSQRDASEIEGDPTGPSRPQSEPHWRTIERTIAVLEKMLQPGARVSHNVFLTELVTGTRRQCDVVIRSGNSPRETIT